MGTLKIIGIYFSGTGNTRHCIGKLTKTLDISAKAISLENGGAAEEIRGNNVIILTYPLQYSNAPCFVRDFIQKNSTL